MKIAEMSSEQIQAERQSNQIDNRAIDRYCQGDTPELVRKILMKQFKKTAKRSNKLARELNNRERDNEC